MAQSLSNILVHIVFGTKMRVNTISSELSHALYDFMGSILIDYNCKALKIGGTQNHIHILCRLSRTIDLSTLVKNIKVETSKWMKRHGPEFATFAWQRGYGAFSISQTHVDEMKRYIDMQEKHHASEPFEYEFRRILEKNKLEYHEDYLWD